MGVRRVAVNELRKPFLPVENGGGSDKESAYNSGDMGSIPGSGSSPRERNTHSDILAWRIPMTEEPGGKQSLG